MSGEFDGWEFAAGVATGQRSWQVDDLGRLRGVTHQAVWKPSENVAKCGYGRQHGLPPATDYPAELAGCTPFEHCSCGFWAYHDGSSYYTDPGRGVAGVIQAYGKVTVGTKGFRAEKARIVALTLPDNRRSRWARLCLWADNQNEGLMLLAIPGAIAGLALTPIFATAAFSENPWWGVPALLSALLLLASIVLVRACFRGIGLERKSSGLSPELAALVRRNYPDVEFYGTRSAMLKAHPVDPQLSPPPPSPDTPGFWDDDDATGVSVSYPPTPAPRLLWVRSDGS